MWKKLQKISTEMSYEELTKLIANQEAFSVKQACQILSIKKTTLYKLHREGNLKFTKIFRRKVVKKSEILRVMSNFDEV